MRILHKFIISISLLLITACTQASLFAVNLPTHFDNVMVTKDIAYGSLPEQKLDIYSPQNIENSQADVVVFFYGGRWETGHKEDYRFAGSALAEKGFLVVIPDYRKYPDAKFPIFVEDSAKAIAWTSNHISHYRGNPARINILGHSAGAHIGALLTTNKKYLQAEGKDRSNTIHSFAGLSGPYDFTPEDQDLKDIFGPPDNYPYMRPTSFVDGTQPPMLLLYGAEDKTVGQFNLKNLEKRIQDKGGCVKTKIYPRIDHVEIIAALSWLGSSKAPILEDITEFFKTDICPK